MVAGCESGSIIIVNLSGRGDKDVEHIHNQTQNSVEIK